MRIRKTQQSDLPQLLQIFNSAIEATTYANAFDRSVGPDELDCWTNGADPDFEAYVCVNEQDAILGWAGIKRFAPWPEAETLREIVCYLDSSVQNGIVGAVLLKSIFGLAVRRGSSSVMAVVLAKNERSIRGLKRAGFVEVARLRSAVKVYGDRADIIWFQRSLQSWPKGPGHRWFE
jgi:L-amino acid N-acyltransferase YncA